tara:strand:- start:454 stop:1302 length:849 start_codon:yes stop_codon:yes gene_type:complete
MPKKWRIIDLINWAEIYFKQKDFKNPRNEIELIIRFVLKIKRIDIYLNFDRVLIKKELELIKKFIKRRIRKEPIQYITNLSEFYGIEFFVNEHVLIPRPETEKLIELAKKKLKLVKNPTILDIGTGSGCIAITMALEKVGCKVMGIDISDNAIKIANKNKNKYNLNNVTFFKIDILNEIPMGNFDLIISNPPYISKNEFPDLMEDVRNYEPKTALTDYSDGLVFYRRYSKIAKQILKESGRMILEVGLGSHPRKVKDIFINQGYINAELLKDFNGDYRILLV